jgi:hypothetical protein
MFIWHKFLSIPIYLIIYILIFRSVSPLDPVVVVALAALGKSAMGVLIVQRPER